MCVSVDHSLNSNKYFISDILGHWLQMSHSKLFLPSGQMLFAASASWEEIVSLLKGTTLMRRKGNYALRHAHAALCQMPDPLQSSFCLDYLFANSIG